MVWEGHFFKRLQGRIYKLADFVSTLQNPTEIQYKYNLKMALFLFIDNNIATQGVGNHAKTIELIGIQIISFL